MAELDGLREQRVRAALVRRRVKGEDALERVAVVAKQPLHVARLEERVDVVRAAPRRQRQHVVHQHALERLVDCGGRARGEGGKGETHA